MNKVVIRDPKGKLVHLPRSVWMTHHRATCRWLAELGVVTVGDLVERWREVRRASLGGDSRYDRRLWRRAQGLLHDLGYEIEETLKDTLRRG